MIANYESQFWSLNYFILYFYLNVIIDEFCEPPNLKFRIAEQKF